MYKRQASYYMSSIGHIMGVHIETDMRRDAFDHLLQLDHTYYNNTKVGDVYKRQVCGGDGFRPGYWRVPPQSWRCAAGHRSLPP